MCCFVELDLHYEKELDPQPWREPNLIFVNNVTT